MPDDSYERQARANGYTIIAGVDEAGRGPWAGPVVAGAAVLDLGVLPDDLLSALDDSKKLKPEKRADLLTRLRSESGAALGVGIASVAEIDEINILQATMTAMKRAVGDLPCSPDMALVDGNRPPDLPCDVRTIIKGDALSLSIAAASIVAKVTRDDIMAGLARVHTQYGWATNAGYGTAAHQRGLIDFGVTKHHRRSFKPIKALLEHG